MEIEKLKEAIIKTEDPNMIRLFNRLANTGETHKDLENLISSGAKKDSTKQRKSCI